MSRHTRLSTRKSKPVKSPVDKIKPHPDAWAEALRLAGGEKRRLQVCRDGAVIVKNPSS